MKQNKARLLRAREFKAVESWEVRKGQIIVDFWEISKDLPQTFGYNSFILHVSSRFTFWVFSLIQMKFISSAIFNCKHYSSFIASYSHLSSPSRNYLVRRGRRWEWPIQIFPYKEQTDISCGALRVFKVSLKESLQTQMVKDLPS